MRQKTLRSPILESVKVNVRIDGTIVFTAFDLGEVSVMKKIKVDLVPRLLLNHRHGRSIKDGNSLALYSNKAHKGRFPCSTCGRLPDFKGECKERFRG